MRLLDRFGDKQIVEESREKYYNGEMDYKSLNKIQFKYMDLTEDEYLDYMLTEIELSPGFEEFYNIINKKDIPFKIISGGFLNGIKAFMESRGFYKIPIYANNLNFRGRDVSIEYYDEQYLQEAMRKDNYIDSKVEIVNKHKEKYDRIIFLGDGSTDVNIADKVDILFAKDKLKDYCEKNNIDYIPWENFYDIMEVFTKEKIY